MSDTKKSEWEEIATAKSGSQGTPGQACRLCHFALYRRGERHKATARDDRHATQGRSDHPRDAVGFMRPDVLAWAGDDAEWRAELATAMRELEYAAEDARYETEYETED